MVLRIFVRHQRSRGRCIFRLRRHFSQHGFSRSGLGPNQFLRVVRSNRAVHRDARVRAALRLPNSSRRQRGRKLSGERNARVRLHGQSESSGHRHRACVLGLPRAIENVRRHFFVHLRITAANHVAREITEVQQRCIAVRRVHRMRAGCDGHHASRLPRPRRARIRRIVSRHRTQLLQQRSRRSIVRRQRRRVVHAHRVQQHRA